MSTPKRLPTGLVATWETVHHDKSPTERANMLELDLNNLGKIRRGDKPLPRRLIYRMQRDVLVSLLGGDQGPVIARRIKVE